MPINPDALRICSEQNVFTEGASAYWDTFSGLIPCKVLKVTEVGYGFRCGPYKAVEFQLTADRGPYKRGEILTADASHVPPKSMIRRLKYSNRIITTYMYKPTTPA